MSAVDYPAFLFGASVLALVVFLHWARRMFWVFSLLVLPGTFAHESCHFLLGLLLNGQPASFTLMPRRDGRGWVMGSVAFTHLRWYNCFFIGMAPLLLLPLAWGLTHWRLRLGPTLRWEEALMVYLIANLIYACVPSWVDVKAAAKSPVGWLLLAGGLAWGYRFLQHRTPEPLAAGAPINKGGY